jgi:hypothetical protein
MATYPADGDRAATLVAAADARMYEQKLASRGPRPEASSRLQSRQELLNRLKVDLAAKPATGRLSPRMT